MSKVVSIGREGELARLRWAIDEAMGGRGRAVLVAGEPGIGKTSLVEDASAYARDRRVHVVVVRCTSSEGAPPYWPWPEALRGCAGESSDDDPARSLLPEGTSHLASGAWGGVDDSSRFELFTRVAGALHAAAQSVPHMLVIEDLHWADTPALRLFEHVVATLHGVPMVLMGTYRDVDVAEPAVRMPGDALRIELRALSRAAVASLVAATAGSVAAASLVDWVHRHTGGNPLFAEEVVRLLMSEGRLDSAPTDLVLPSGVRGVIERRIRVFPPGVVDVLRWAALYGDEFDSAVVARASGCSHRAVGRALAAARQRRLVRRLPERPGWYEFTHGLVAETLRDGLLPPDRCGRHLRLGEALRQRAPAASAAEISRHLHAALPQGDPRVAADLAVSAAHEAARALAWEEAARFYEHALSALALIEESSARSAELLVERAIVVSVAGEAPDARKAAAAAVDAARTSRSPTLLARAALAFSARTFTDGGDATTANVLEEAIAGLPAGDTAERVMLLARLAEEAHNVDRARSGRLADEAVAMADRLHDPAASWEALIQQHRARRGGVDLDERLATSDALVHLADQMHDPERALHGRIRRFVDLMTAGRRTQLDLELRTFTTLVDRDRQAAFRWLVPLWKGTRALAEGRLADAERLAVECLELSAARGEYAVGQGLFLLAGIRLQQRRLGEVEPILAAAGEQHPTLPVYRCALAFVHTELGRPASAKSLLEPLAVDDFTTIPLDQEWTATAHCLTEATVALHRADWGRSLRDRLAPYADHHAATSSGALYFGPVARALGQLSALGEDWDQADVHLATALDAARRFGASLWTAQTALDRARVLTARGRPEDEQEAKQLLADAIACATEMRLPRLRELADQLDATLAAAPARGPATRNVFRKQGDYWTLTYLGRTAQVRDRKGLHDIAALLAAPGRELHVLEIHAAHGEPRHDSGADPALDATARRNLQQRFAELQEDYEEAERFADTARAALARSEMDAIATYLAQAFGLGGRPRRPGEPVERARKAVRRRIRTSIDAIQREMPALARHLEHALRTGTFCSYSPEHSVEWSLAPDEPG